MRRIIFLLLLFAKGCWHVSVYCLCAAVVVLAWVGLLAVSDALQPPHLPAVRLLPPELWYLASSGERPTRAELLAMSKFQRWETMQRALLILDAVCPAVASWTRRMYHTGHLVFETPERPWYAWYRLAPSTLAINLSALEQSDAALACTLAHEFRHSRQNLLRMAQASIAGWCGLDRRFELVEEEAYEFERRIGQAILGIP